MAFANVWDTTFPPDTQLANLLGQDIRNGVKVDVQQRMAAISGLDAAKPAFGADAQPANWNGILFFATDTGNIYQFNNPAWTNITTNFIFRNNAFKNVTPVTQTGDTTLHTIYTLAIPGNTLGTTGQLRITLPMRLNQAAGFPKISLGYGVAGNIFGLSSLTSGTGNDYSLTYVGGNTGATNSQSWDRADLPMVVGGSQVFNLVGHQTSAIDSTLSQNVIVQYQGGANSDSITFQKILVEVL